MKLNLGQEYLEQEGRQHMMEIVTNGKVVGKRIITTSVVGKVIEADGGKLIDVDEILDDGKLVFFMPIN